MSIFHKTNISSLVICFLLSVLPAASMNMADIPSSVTIDYLQDLYVEVVFDHQMHSDMFECSSCHHHTAGTGAQKENCKKCHISSEPSNIVSCSGCHKYKPPVPGAGTNQTTDSTIYHIDKPSLKGALHLQCRGCHQIENGPTGCQECHSFTPAGRKRFAVKD